MLDEVQYFIDNYQHKIQFILTGSSARKLKRRGVNLLAGRAWKFLLHPLTHYEIGDNFNLDIHLRFGSLPRVILENEEESSLTLKAYTETYLKEEIADEATVRNLGNFALFLELAAHNSGDIINFTTISREIGVSANTVKGYYQILEDTLITIKLPAFEKSMRKRIVRHPKIYLFDIGVLNALTKRLSVEPTHGTDYYGKLFEHFIILEIYRIMSYKNKEIELFYWRTTHGQEVDLIIKEGPTLKAIEIKSSSSVREKDLFGLMSFKSEHPISELMCISQTPRAYSIGDIEILPWKEAMQKFI